MPEKHEINSDEQPGFFARTSAAVLMKILGPWVGPAALSPYAVLMKDSDQFRRLVEMQLAIPDDNSFAPNDVERLRDKINFTLGGMAHFNKQKGHSILDLSIGRFGEILLHKITWLRGKANKHAERNLLPSIGEVELPIENLPTELKGVKIYQLSDWHINPLKSFHNLDLASQLVDDLNESIEEDDKVDKPSIVVFTGDLFTDGDDTTNENFIERTKEILKKIKTEHKYAILGNHDYIAGEEVVTALLEEAEFKVLINDVSEEIKIGSSSIQVAGIDDVTYGNVNIEAVREKIRSKVSADALIQLLHDPMGRVAFPTMDRPVVSFAGHIHDYNGSKAEKTFADCLEKTGYKVNGISQSELPLTRLDDLSSRLFGESVFDPLYGIFRDSRNQLIVVSSGIGTSGQVTRNIPPVVPKCMLV